MFNVINKPAVTLTDAAVAKVREIVEAQGQADAGLRVEETWERAGRSFAALVPDGVVRPLGLVS